jgi:hypothetical protein
VATKRNVVQEYLARLATDPAKLGRFILDPEGEMNHDKIPKKNRADIQNALAIEIARKLVVSPEGCTVHLVR